MCWGLCKYLFINSLEFNLEGFAEQRIFLHRRKIFNLKMDVPAYIFEMASDKRNILEGKSRVIFLYRKYCGLEHTAVIILSLDH